MKKRILRAAIALLGATALFVCALTGTTSNIKIEDDPVALSDGSGTLVQQTADDINVIPDKYNTGAKGELTKVALGDKVEGIQFAAGGGGSKNVMDFYYRNKTIEGTVTIENYDFSSAPVCIYNAELVKRDIKIIFNNCKFSNISVCRNSPYFSFEFNGCTLNSFSGGNTILDRCRIGGSINDGILPYQNVEVKNCLICDMGGQKLESGSVHTDGTQLYGAKGVDVKNVSYKNCRFELPPVAPEGSKAYVNACIMLQMEYSNADTITVSDCYVNGGGFSIYARSAKEEYTLSNVNFKNVHAGCAAKYGILCNNVTPGVTYDSLTSTNALYVASVWKENGKTHFSVTNDTNQERKLVIITNAGEYEYSIPACKTGSEITSEDVYSDMPFDLDIVVPENCEYAICFDATLERYATQIRYMNWNGKKAYLSKKQSEDLLSGAEELLSSGACGKNVKYTLNKAGILKLEGTGPTYSYNSKNAAPWKDYSKWIKKVYVGEGITKVGNQLFMGGSCMQEVTLPDSLTVIDSRVFSGCCGLKTITLPAGLTQIREYALPYNTLTSVLYKGTDWNDIELVGNNDGFEQRIAIAEAEPGASVTDEEEQDEETVILSGQCGKEATYELLSDGCLRIEGSGATYNYNSNKPAPWYDYRSQIVKVEIDEGITTIGAQAFRNCTNLSQVELPKGLITIGSNVFIGCKSLNKIEIPTTVETIGQMAFHGAGVNETIYQSTEEKWNQISIASHNDPLIKNLIFSE